MKRPDKLVAEDPVLSARPDREKLISKYGSVIAPNLPACSHIIIRLGSLSWMRDLATA